MVKNDLIAALITESAGKMSTALKGKKYISGKLNHLDILCHATEPHSHKKVRTGWIIQSFKVIVNKHFNCHVELCIMGNTGLPVESSVNTRCWLKSGRWNIHRRGWLDAITSGNNTGMFHLSARLCHFLLLRLILSSSIYFSSLFSWLTVNNVFHLVLYNNLPHSPSSCVFSSCLPLQIFTCFVLFLFFFTFSPLLLISATTNKLFSLMINLPITFLINWLFTQ